jgi:hypothetical protein
MPPTSQARDAPDVRHYALFVACVAIGVVVFLLLLMDVFMCVRVYVNALAYMFVLRAVLTFGSTTY